MSFKCSAQFNFVLFQKLKIFHTKMTSLVLGMSIFFHNFQIREGTCFLFGIIGIKHDFLCINICWAPREVLKPEASLKGKGFNTTWGAQQMLMYQKSMFDHYYCIKTCFFAWKLWRNCFKKFFLPVPIMARKSTLPANVLKTPFPGQRLTSSLLCNLLMMTSVFMMSPECLFVKTQSRT